MIAIALWQSLLNGLGWCMAQVYDLIPNYALTIIAVTVVIRVLLLPFGFKQIKSMQHMQALQPKIKDLQRKYKNNKQKQQEETMKLYKEAGVNPLGGCLPMLLTLPFLFAMYAVIRPPVLSPNADASGNVASYTVLNNHLPTDSTLFYNVVEHQNLDMLSVNLQCALATSGSTVVEKDSHKQPIVEGKPILASGNVPIASNPRSQATLDCGAKKFPDAIPYVALLLLMLGTAIFQQRQMTKANPPSANAGPNAAVMKYMPLLYGVWGFAFPAGLIVYWTTANAIQIGQQFVMLRAGHIGPEALERRMAEQRAKLAANDGKPQRKGIMGWMNEKAAQAQQQQETGPKRPSAKGGAGSPPRKKPSDGGGGDGAATPKQSPRKPTKGAAPGNQLRPKKKP
jgi:YidC/Oxa1 family membrane protein insertase